MTAFKAAFSSAACIIIVLHVVEFCSIQGKVVIVAEKMPEKNFSKPSGFLASEDILKHVLVPYHRTQLT